MVGGEQQKVIIKQTLDSLANAKDATVFERNFNKLEEQIKTSDLKNNGAFMTALNVAKVSLNGDYLDGAKAAAKDLVQINQSQDNAFYTATVTQNRYDFVAPVDSTEMDLREKRFERAFGKLINNEGWEESDKLGAIKEMAKEYWMGRGDGNGAALLKSLEGKDVDGALAFFAKKDSDGAIISEAADAMKGISQPKKDFWAKNVFAKIMEIREIEIPVVYADLMTRADAAMAARDKEGALALYMDAYDAASGDTQNGTASAKIAQCCFELGKYQDAKEWVAGAETYGYKSPDFETLKALINEKLDNGLALFQQDAVNVALLSSVGGDSAIDWSKFRAENGTYSRAKLVEYVTAALDKDRQTVPTTDKTVLAAAENIKDAASKLASWNQGDLLKTMLDLRVVIDVTSNKKAKGRVKIGKGSGAKYYQLSDDYMKIPAWAKIYESIVKAIADGDSSNSIVQSIKKNEEEKIFNKINKNLDTLLGVNTANTDAQYVSQKNNIVTGFAAILETPDFKKMAEYKADLEAYAKESLMVKINKMTTLGALMAYEPDVMAAVIGKTELNNEQRTTMLEKIGKMPGLVDKKTGNFDKDAVIAEINAYGQKKESAKKEKEPAEKITEITGKVTIADPSALLKPEQEKSADWGESALQTKMPDLYSLIIDNKEGIGQSLMENTIGGVKIDQETANKIMTEFVNYASNSQDPTIISILNGIANKETPIEDLVGKAISRYKIVNEIAE